MLYLFSQYKKLFLIALFLGTSSNLLFGQNPVDEKYRLGASNIISIVPTSDTVKARGFYEGKLGLTYKRIDKYALVFGNDGSEIRVSFVGKHEPLPFSILAWIVPDMKKAIEKLSVQGIKFEKYGNFKQDDLGIWEASDGTKIAWFKDPDGNILSLTQYPDSLQK